MALMRGTDKGQLQGLQTPEQSNEVMKIIGNLINVEMIKDEVLNLEEWSVINTKRSWRLRNGCLFDKKNVLNVHCQQVDERRGDIVYHGQRELGGKMLWTTAHNESFHLCCKLRPVNKMLHKLHRAVTTNARLIHTRSYGEGNLFKDIMKGQFTKERALTR